MSARLEGKVAIVTGGARGIGRAVVREFAAAGAMVHAIDQFESELQTVAEECRSGGGKVTAWGLDIRDDAAVNSVFSRIEKKEGYIDVLLNNAAIIFFKPIEATSVEDWDRLLAINLRGPFLCTRAIAQGMKARKSGAIINVSSNAGVKGGNNETAYCASKFGIEGFSRALAIEMKPYNVSVNTVTPGHPVHTAMSETTYGSEQRKIWKDPAEIAPAFVHLALQDADGINDQYIHAWDLVLELRKKGIR